MMDEPNNLNDDEKLKAENEFLKLKLMAEHGGEFFARDVDADIPTEVENAFLNNVLEFERQFSSHRTITVYEKIGSPDHFKIESEIPDEEIENAWEDLSDYMGSRGVELSVCSPNVSARELYRFATEELFKQETDDIHIPGMLTGFIYDEFYPDHEYDNSRAATDYCMGKIFNKEPLEWMHHFAEQIRLNRHSHLTRDQFKNVINRFKDLYDEIEMNELVVDSVTLNENLCPVQGKYSATAKMENEIMEYKGNWLAEFTRNDDFGYWYITNVQIQGVNF